MATKWAHFYLGYARRLILERQVTFVGTELHLWNKEFELLRAISFCVIIGHTYSERRFL